MIAIHQPEFMPWLGFFDKMMRADKYVIFDHVQFKKRYFENRNRIKRDEQTVWLSAPVKTKGKYLQPINEVAIDNSTPWQKRMWETIRHGYSKSPYFSLFAEEIEQLIMKQEYQMLMDFNLACICWFRKVLTIENPVVFSSRLGVADYKASDLIREICKRMDAQRYLCGPSGKDYLNEDDFRREGIEIVWQEFQHPKYPQLSHEFTPYMSVLDLVFNCGLKSRDVIEGYHSG